MDQFAPFLVVGVAIAFIVAFFVGQSRQRRARTRMTQVLASRRGLRSDLSSLPADFPRRILDDLFPGFIWSRWSHAHNIVAGYERADYLLAFDVLIQNGRSSSPQTIVARRLTRVDVRLGISPGYRYRVAGEWQAVTRRNRFLIFLPKLLTIDEIERQWKILQ